MPLLSKLFFQHFFTTLLVLITTTLLTLSFAASNDLAEELWSALRPLEYWQIDEILLAMFIALIVALIVAFVQIASLSKEVRQLKTSNSDLRPDDGRSGNYTHYVARCPLCSKYQLNDDLWLGDAKYISRQFHTKVIAGICPDCQK